MTKATRASIAVVVVVMALGLSPLLAAPARAAAVPYDLYGSLQSGWGLTSTSETNPGPTLKANAGDTVTITLHSTDGYPHRLLIDLNGNGVADPGEPVSAVFNTTTTLTFVASQAGTFTYLCTIHGSAMEGTFQVQGTTSPSSSGPSAASSSTLLIVGIVIAVVALAGVSVLVLRSRH